jgi:hypothetical protein
MRDACSASCPRRGIDPAWTALDSVTVCRLRTIDMKITVPFNAYDQSFMADKCVMRVVPHV